MDIKIETWFYTEGKPAFPGPVFNTKEKLKEWYKRGYLKGTQYTLLIKQNDKFIHIKEFIKHE